jgi:hypothetical protein
LLDALSPFRRTEISPAAFERRAGEEGVDADAPVDAQNASTNGLENHTERGFPQRPHPPSFSWKEERTTNGDQLNETVH